MAYDLINPIGQERDDLNAARIAMFIRGQYKDTSIADVQLPFFLAPKPKQSVNDMKTLLMGFAAQHKEKNG